MLTQELEQGINRPLRQPAAPGGLADVIPHELGRLEQQLGGVLGDFAVQTAGCLSVSTRKRTPV